MTPSDVVKLITGGCQSGLAAIRCTTKLQPAEGEGGKAFPPTFANGEYAVETRLIGGARTETVLLDSVQSQANRFEEALFEAHRAGTIDLPLFEMTVAGHEVSTLTVPHRVHDAIFRDSLWGGKLFRESPNGKRLVEARAWNASAFYEFAPTVLLFGTWDSQSGGGTNTAKVARCLVSEIIGIDAVRGVRTSSRIDPLGIKLMTGVIRKSGGPEVWSFVEPATGAKKEAKKEKDTVRPSEINHGNVAPSITNKETGPGGMTFREAVQTTVLSFAQLRKLRFPDAAGSASAERDAAGRAVIAALGLYAVALSQESGYQLRSRCQLIPLASPRFEAIGKTLDDRREFALSAATARESLRLALAAAEQHGLRWNRGSIRLEPRPDLVKLVELSDKSTAAETE